jgi:hypothetical protein
MSPAADEFDAVPPDLIYRAAARGENPTVEREITFAIGECRMVAIERHDVGGVSRRNAVRDPQRLGTAG